MGKNGIIVFLCCIFLFFLIGVSLKPTPIEQEIKLKDVLKDRQVKRYINRYKELGCKVFPAIGKDYYSPQEYRTSLFLFVYNPKGYDYKSYFAITDTEITTVIIHLPGLVNDGWRDLRKE